MADPTNKTWREVRRQRPLNEDRVAAYKLLMDAEARLEEVRRRRGVSTDALANAVEPEDGTDDEPYIAALERYVGALGGYLEVRAVFPDETVTVLRRPAPPSDA